MIKRIKQKRITLYAKSGRVSIKRIISIINDHIESNNKCFAIKALNELKAVVNQQHNNYIDTIDDMNERIKCMSCRDTPGGNFSQSKRGKRETQKKQVPGSIPTRIFLK